MINQGIFVLISVATNLSIAPLTPIYMAEWDKSLSQVALLVCFLPRSIWIMRGGVANIFLRPELV